MYDAPPNDEWVTLDCETTGLDVHRDQIVSIGAVRIAGNRLLTSQRLELLVRPERALTAEQRARAPAARTATWRRASTPEQAMRRLLDFIGSRPLVGYYLEFDVAMINREIWPLLGVRLPQPKIEVSAMYYDYKNRQLPAARARRHASTCASQTMMNELDAAAARRARRAQRRGDGRAGVRQAAGACWPRPERGVAQACAMPRRNSSSASFTACGRSCWVQWPQPGSISVRCSRGTGPDKPAITFCAPGDVTT